MNSNLDLTDKITLAKAIHQLFNTENKLERESIQQQLEGISNQDPMFHAQTITELLTDTSSQDIKDIKMSLSIYCKQFYRVVASNGYNNINIPATLQHIQYLLVCFESPAIELKQKYSIFGALEQMILLYKYQENEGPKFWENITQILNRIQQLAVTGQQAQDGDMIKSSFMLTEVLFSVNQNEVHEMTHNICIGPLLQVVDSQMISLNTDILALNSSLKQDQLQLTRENPLVMSIMHKIDIIRSFIRMIYRVFEKVTNRQEYYPIYLAFIKSTHLASIFIRTFGIGIQIPNSPNNNSVINITGLQILDNQINELKTKSLECINFLLKEKNKDKQVLICIQNKQHQTLNGLVSLVPLLIQSLIIFGQRTDLEQLLDEERISNFVIEALENLSLTTQYDEYKEIFFRFLPNLILDVGLNFIKTTETERQEMYDNPQEFVNLALDTCDKQKSNTVKTQAAKLFEGLCDNIDGAVTLTSYFSIQALNMTLSKESSKAEIQITEFAANIDDAHLNLITQCSFMKHSKPDVIVDASIMVLGLLSYVHSKQQYITVFNWIEKVFQYYINEILNNESKLVKARYSLFLGYLIDVLFKNEPDAFRSTVMFLYQSVDLQGEDKAIALQSIDTLKTITCDQDLIPRIQQMNLVPELISMIINSIGTIQNFEYMEFVNDFIITYRDILNDQIGLVAQAVVNRTQKELLKPINGNHSQLVQKCMNILKQITQNKALMLKYSDQFQEIYKPIFEFMVDPTKIQVEDDILIILKNFIKKTSKVSDIIFTVFPCMQNVFVKNKNTFGDTLMDTLNYYMIFGKEKIMQDPNCIRMLIQIADQALFSVEPNITVNNAEGAIFLQIIFQIFQGTELLNEYFETILGRILERMKGSTELPVKPSLKKHLLQVFLSALFYNASATIRYMEQHQVSKEILLNILQTKKTFKNTYERKCFIVGITHILGVADLPDTFRDPSTTSRLLQEILSMLQKIQKKEANEASKKAAKQIHQDDNSNDDEDSSDPYYDSEEDDDDEPNEFGKRSRGNSGQHSAEEMMDDEEQKTDNGGGLGLVDKPKKVKDDSDDSKSDDEYDCQFELAVTVDQIKSPMTLIDEFELFSKTVNQLAHQRPQEIGQIISMMSKEQNDLLKSLLQTKRITIQAENQIQQVGLNGEQIQAPRKVLKAKRRTTTQQ